MGRRPIGDERKWSQLRIRLTDGERNLLDQIAGSMPTSTWARELLLREAKRRSKSKGRALTGAN